VAAAGKGWRMPSPGDRRGGGPGVSRGGATTAWVRKRDSEWPGAVVQIRPRPPKTVKAGKKNELPGDRRRRNERGQFGGPVSARPVMWIGARRKGVAE